jgi:hypothetical protein
VAEYSLLELASRLAADPGEKALYQTDPPGYLDSRGYGELSPDELHDALGHVADSVPPELAAVLDPSAGLDQLAEADLNELGIEELFGVPVEPVPDTGLGEAPSEAFDDDPSGLDALDDEFDDELDDEFVDDGPGQDGDDATSTTAAPTGDELAPTEQGTSDDLDAVAARGEDALDDDGGLSTPDPFGAAADSGFDTVEDPFVDLDEGQVPAIDPATPEPLEAELEGPDSIWDDFDV